MVRNYDELVKILKENSYSLTAPRAMVFEALTTSGAISMGTLVQKLDGKMNRSSVYRTIELFEKIGIVNRLWIGWKYKLELSERFSTHHHHATCVQCGCVIEFSEGSSIEAEIDQIADRINLDLISHSLELRGTCQECARLS